MSVFPKRISLGRHFITGKLFIVASGCLFGSIAISNPANAQSTPCKSADQSPRCVAEAEAKRRALYDVPAIESFAGKNVQLMRAFFVSAFGANLGTVSVIREPFREPHVKVRMSGTPPSIMSAELPLGTWDRLVRDGDYFDRKFTPIPDRNEKDICVDGEGTLIEAIDVHGKTRKSWDGSCDNGLGYRLALALAKAAVDTMPACALLKPIGAYDEMRQLEHCALLAGDRAAAAAGL